MNLFKTILRTVFTKGLGSVLSFLVVVLTAKYMGAEGRGEINLLVLNITVILLINDLAGGGALVFLIPRHSLYALLLPAWIWGLFCGLCFPFLFYLLGHLTLNSWILLSLLSVSLNLSSINSAALNGKEKIKENNIVSISQILLLVLLLCFFLFVMGKRTPIVFSLSLLCSYAFSFCLSLFFLRKDLSSTQVQNPGRMFKQMVRSGFFVQLGNAVQLLNYRISFYLLYYFFPLTGKALVGVYGTGVSVCESVWVISNGISMVQYARIANMKVRKDAQDLSIALSKISFLATLLALIVLLALPGSFFKAVFGPEFGQLPYVIGLLGTGIAAFGLTCIYSHYFSGLGKMHISSYSSVVGFAVTLAAGFVLIPRHGIYGAALTATCSYLASAVYLLVRFRNECDKSYLHLLFSYEQLFTVFKTRAEHVRN
jgi:O-antigen/teichoic acid export membrane protein